MSRVHPRDGSDIDTVETDREGRWFVATAKGTDITSQGKSVPEALANLAEALRLHEEITPGTLDNIAKQAGTDDGQAFRDWLLDSL